MFSFDSGNRTLNFSTDFFAALAESALLAQITVRVGDIIAPGAPLGTLVMSGGKNFDMITPSGVAGTIAALNGRIRYEALHEEPQFMLRLQPGF